MGDNIHFKSESNEWETPQDLFNEYYDYYEGVLLGRLKLVDDPNYN